MTALFSGNEMTIDYKIIVGQRLSPHEETVIKTLIQETFTEVNTLYNKWNPQSELSQLNQLPANLKKEISPELFQLLELTQKMVLLTEGRFDPTIEPLQQLWRAALLKKTVPSEEEIQSIVPAIGWDKIHYEDRLFWKEHAQTRLDLGGIAKGYCVDLLVERLNAKGFYDVFVEWGGEIRASGQHPNQRPWNIFISRLGDTNPENSIAHLNLINQAIATSGDYLQNWSTDTQTFFHVLDPKNHHLMPIKSGSIAMTSVLGSSCAEADALATALMVFSSVKEAEIWAESIKEKRPGVMYWIISRSKSKD
jgi:FAD:protein FMN transferase